MYAKKEKLYPVCVSKHNLNREKQVILLMVPNREGQKRLCLRELIPKNTKLKEDIKCNNMIKEYKTSLTLIML